MRLRRPTPATGGTVAATAIVCAACGAGASSTAIPTASPAASPTPAPTVGPEAPPAAPVLPSPTSLANVTPTPQPTLAGVHYIVPPGWTIASAAAADARLTTDSGLTIELRLADGSTSIVTAANGRPVSVDGATGFESDARAASIYRDQIDTQHGGHVYEIVCTSPDPEDRQTTVDICEGFAYGMTWA